MTCLSHLKMYIKRMKLGNKHRWVQVMNQPFYKKNLIGRAIWERKYFIGIAQYKEGVELELMKYSLPNSRIYYTEFIFCTVFFCSVRRFWHICLALFPRGRASRHKTLLNFPFPKGFLRPSLCRVLTARDKPARPFEYFLETEITPKEN